MNYYTPNETFPVELIEKQKIIPYSIFLGGTIDNGKAPNWQKKFVDECPDLNFLTIFNPRITEWNTSIKETINDTRFFKHVAWEQEGLKYASLIFMYFIGGSVSIISMSELGQYANSGKLIVVAEKDYHKRGNIEFLSVQEGFPLFETFEQGRHAAISSVTQKYIDDIKNQFDFYAHEIKIRRNKRNTY